MDKVRRRKEQLTAGRLLVRLLVRLDKASALVYTYKHLIMAPEVFLKWMAEQDAPPDKVASNSTLGRLIAGPVDCAPRARTIDYDDSAIRVLMLLCQKVGSTGSGVVVKEIIDRGAEVGVEYGLICGEYEEDATQLLFEAPPIFLRRIQFQSAVAGGLPFPIVGMSNRMPYPSMAFRDLTFEQLAAYLDLWAQEIHHAIQEFRPHLIHVHHLWLLSALAASERPRFPVVVSVHGTDLHRAHDCPHLASLVSSWIPTVETLILLTEGDSPTLDRYYQTDSARTVVLGNGFSERLFFPASPDTGILGRYSLQAARDFPIVLFVGKFEQWKGIRWLLRAFSKVVRDEVPSAVLAVVGSGPDEELRSYQALVASLGVQSSVHFLGAVRHEDVAQLMNAGTVFVLPSYQEPFGLALLEALACGCPVVATDEGGPHLYIPRALQENGDALLIKSLVSGIPGCADGDRFVEELGAAISRQLSRPLTLERRLSIASHVANLTWREYVRRLKSVYAHVSNPKLSGPKEVE